jgi:hypothetical protein
VRSRPHYTSYLDLPGPGQHSATALDAVHLAHNRARRIPDVKYEAAGPRGRYPNPDHYQMLAYCTAPSIPHAWGVYAQGTGSPQERPIKDTKIIICQYPPAFANPALVAAADRRTGPQGLASADPGAKPDPAANPEWADLHPIAREASTVASRSESAIRTALVQEPNHIL